MPFLNTFASIVLLLGGKALSTKVPEPTAPALEYLYTAYALIEPGIYSSQGPRGIRTALPIKGGNFTGPRMNGKILDLGADWGLTDPQTGVFSPDTRYNLQTDDGANILIQTSGAEQPDTNIHLRLVFETGDRNYYWLNFVTAVGILQQVETFDNGSFVLRIDAWNLANEWKNTTFKNSTQN